MSKLANKVALVTGGSRGIGAAIAKRLAADGASVAITYAKDAAAASTVVKAIELSGGKAIAIQADAADAKAAKGAVEKAVATFGRLDVLVNNAGTAIPKPFEETTLEEMDRVLDINVRGVFAATQAALKHMQSGARIFLAEKWLTLTLVAIDLGKSDQRSGFYRAINPRRVVPTLVLKDGTPIGEVPAIMRSLDETFVWRSPVTPRVGDADFSREILA